MLGWLFRNKSQSTEKGNLYVFLTPHIIKSPEEAAEIYNKKKKAINAIEEKSIKMYESGDMNVEDTRKAPGTVK
jgi:general secretion pathway protein D